MIPTPRAIALSGPIQQALAQIQTAIENESKFDPMTSDRIFRIGMDDYTEIVFLSKLMRSLKQSAPQVRIQVKSSTRHTAPDLLDQDKVDLALGYFPHFSAWHQRQTLYPETFVCVANSDFFKRCFKGNSKRKQRLTLEEYISAPHLLVSPKEDMIGAVDERLTQQGLTRTIALSVPNFSIVPFILCNNDLIATLPTQLVDAFQQAWSLQVFPMPLKTIQFSIDMLWHRKQNSEPGHMWLKQRVIDLCSGISLK